MFRANNNSACLKFGIAPDAHDCGKLTAVWENNVGRLQAPSAKKQTKAAHAHRARIHMNRKADQVHHGDMNY